MIKQIITLIALSLLIIVTITYAQQGLHALVAAHNWVSDSLKVIFSGGEAGSLIRKLLALLALPIIISLIPATIYWLARRHWFPYFMQMVWIIWLIQTSAVTALHKGL